MDAAPSVAHVARLLDLDADLAEALDSRSRLEARSQVLVQVVDLAEGSFSGQQLSPSARGAFAILVVDGLIVREVALGEIVATSLLGPFDVVPIEAPADQLLPTDVRYTVSERARLAVLGDAVLPALRTWPVLGRRLVTRAASQAAREAEHRAIAQLPRVEDRLLALFWHLAQRWGRVSPSGLIVPMTLTHRALGRLVGARRPTVSLALKALSSEGVVYRRDDGTWLVRHGSEAALAPAPAIAEAGVALSPDAPRREVRPPAVAAALTRAEASKLIETVSELRELHAARVARTRDILERSAAIRSAIAERRLSAVISGRRSPRSAPSPR